MLEIISWNVAGWRSAFEKIKAANGSFDNWIEKLGADIVCLQEVKMSEEDIKFNPKVYIQAGIIRSYNTYWM